MGLFLFFLSGDTEWLPGQELPVSPWDLVRKPLSQCITIRLKGNKKQQREKPGDQSVLLQQLRAHTRIRAAITGNKCHLVDERAQQICLDAFAA